MFITTEWDRCYIITHPDDGFVSKVNIQELNLFLKKNKLIIPKGLDKKILLTKPILKNKNTGNIIAIPFINYYISSDYKEKINIKKKEVIKWMIRRKQ